MSKFYKGRDKIFKTETCSVSILPLHKFIKTKSTSLIVTSRINIDHHYQFFDYSQQNYACQYKKIKRHMSLPCRKKRRYY